MRLLLLFLFPMFAISQDVEIGKWKDYRSYNSASYITEAENRIYCVTASGGLFYFNKDDYTINRMSKVIGLSDVEIKRVGYSKELNVTVVIYKNCNIDLIKNNNIINISDIKRKEIIGEKSINNITIEGNIAYLSSSFGLILLDINKEEIKNTYQVGEEGVLFEINGCALIGDSVVVATNNGLFFAKTNNPNLNDYNNWQNLKIFQSEGVFENIVSSGSKILADTSSEITSISFNNGLFVTTFDSVIIVSDGDFETNYLTHSKLKKIKHAWIDMQENIWVADSVNGLLKFENYGYFGSFVPEGPLRNDVYSVEFVDNKLYYCHGGHINFSANALINDGVSIKNKYDEWENYNSQKLGRARDILEVAVKNGTEYYASWYNGIPVMKNGELIGQWNNANTNGVLDTTYYSTNRIRISDLKFDEDGNLWGLSSEVNHPLFVKTKNGEWYSFTLNQNQVGFFLDDLLIDSYNQIWGVLARGGGVFVYNHNNTIGNSSDDQYRFLKTGLGEGNIASLQTYAIAEDLNKHVWLGTDRGISVFYNPNDMFSGNNFDSEQILIQEGDYGQYLLSEEKIKCIAVDGANRKWIGTEKSGVFLLSENGTEEVLHFTTENSPLFSNNIIDIAINNENGEVFLATAKGCLSYRSDATQGVQYQQETHVFPNPVRESYNGPIAISGLVKNANVKITDISGALIFETTAQGGQAIWNGKNKNNERASSGVYIVFSTDLNGTEKAISKILFIH